MSAVPAVSAVFAVPAVSVGVCRCLPVSAEVGLMSKTQGMQKHLWYIISMSEMHCLMNLGLIWGLCMLGAASASSTLTQSPGPENAQPHHQGN